jgi:hypothetical protein
MLAAITTDDCGVEQVLADPILDWKRVLSSWDVVCGIQHSGRRPGRIARVSPPARRKATPGAGSSLSRRVQGMSTRPRRTEHHVEDEGDDEARHDSDDDLAEEVALFAVRVQGSRRSMEPMTETERQFKPRLTRRPSGAGTPGQRRGNSTTARIGSRGVPHGCEGLRSHPPARLRERSLRKVNHHRNRIEGQRYDDVPSSVIFVPSTKRCDHEERKGGSGGGLV